MQALTSISRLFFWLFAVKENEGKGCQDVWSLPCHAMTFSFTVNEVSEGGEITANHFSSLLMLLCSLRQEWEVAELNQAEMEDVTIHSIVALYCTHGICDSLNFFSCSRKCRHCRAFLEIVLESLYHLRSCWMMVPSNLCDSALLTTEPYVSIGQSAGRFLPKAIII